MESAKKGNALSKTSARFRWPSVWMAAVGLLLMFGSVGLMSASRGSLASTGPLGFRSLWRGAGGLALLYMAAGVPLGAVLLSAGGARLFPDAGRTGRVLWPLLCFQTAYFACHGVTAFRYSGVPTTAFTIFGWLFVFLFLALVYVWASRRPGMGAERQWTADLQLAAGLCFFTAAWETCGLAGVPGFAVYPDLAQKLANESFLVGQALAVQIFSTLGFLALLAAMHSERP